MQRGVYFLADDGVYDLVVTFLNSFRRYNQDIPLCLIPYNSQIDRLQALQPRYRFSIYPRPDILRRCDEISLRFHPQVAGHYRKLAMWEGNFDEFIYIDVDTVVLANVDFVFEFLAEYDFVTSHSNIPGIVQWVWQPSIYQTGQLSDEQIAFSANTGFICSKQGTLTLESIVRTIPSAVELAAHMTLFCMEQPLLNYLIVTSGRRYTSLLVLTGIKGHAGIMLEFWAGLKGAQVEDGQLVLGGQRAPILLVHWAGEWKPRRSDHFIDGLRRLLRLRDERPAVRRFMPYRKLWQYYRALPLPADASQTPSYQADLQTPVKHITISQKENRWASGDGEKAASAD